MDCSQIRLAQIIGGALLAEILLSDVKIMKKIWKQESESLKLLESQKSELEKAVDIV